MTTPALGSNSVLDKMRASGMSDDQIIAAIMSFGTGQNQPQPVQYTGNDPVALMRSQGYTDEQITAQVVASAHAATFTGSGDPTAAGGLVPIVADLRNEVASQVGTASNVLSGQQAHAQRLEGVESDINRLDNNADNVDTHLTEHSDRLAALELQLAEVTSIDAKGDHSEPDATADESLSEPATKPPRKPASVAAAAADGGDQ